MSLNTFAITSISIHRNEMWNTNILKVLKQGENYRLNSYDEGRKNILPENFFASNICISAIVGKNGCGKSSLLDLMLRMFNNLGYCMLASLRVKPNDSSLGFVPQIFADVNYVIKKEGDLLDCCLRCENGRISLRVSDRVYVFPIVDTGIEYDYSPIENSVSCENMSMTDLSELSDCLFYTIGVNYSLHSFVANDYEGENPIWFGKNDLNTWVDGVFHKNDGYRTPLVLTPYRRDGNINMANINDLVRTYIIAILAYNSERKYKKEFIPDYLPGPIIYKRNIDKLLRKCSGRNQYKFEEFRRRFLAVCSADGSIVKKMLSRYGVRTELANVRDNQLCVYMYLMYKTISICKTYSDYSQYDTFGGYELLTEDERTSEHSQKQIQCEGLVAEILNDRSHITYKIRQALNLIWCLESSNQA